MEFKKKRRNLLGLREVRRRRKFLHYASDKPLPSIFFFCCFSFWVLFVIVFFECLCVWYFKIIFCSLLFGFNRRLLLTCSGYIWWIFRSWDNLLGYLFHPDFMGLLSHGFKVVLIGVRYGLLCKALDCSTHQFIFQPFLSVHLKRILISELILQGTQRWTGLELKGSLRLFWRLENGFWGCRFQTAAYVAKFNFFQNLLWCTLDFWNVLDDVLSFG